MFSLWLLCIQVDRSQRSFDAANDALDTTPTVFVVCFTMASEALSPEAQVLYILSTLHRQKLLTRRERNLLKGTV